MFVFLLWISDRVTSSQFLMFQCITIDYRNRINLLSNESVQNASATFSLLMMYWWCDSSDCRKAIINAKPKTGQSDLNAMIKINVNVLLCYLLSERKVSTKKLPSQVTIFIFESNDSFLTYESLYFSMWSRWNHFWRPDSHATSQIPIFLHIDIFF